MSEPSLSNLKRRAAEIGLRFTKSAWRADSADNLVGYRVINVAGNYVVAGSVFELDLAGVRAVIEQQEAVEAVAAQTANDPASVGALPGHGSNNPRQENAVNEQHRTTAPVAPAITTTEDRLTDTLALVQGGNFADASAEERYQIIVDLVDAMSDDDIRLVGASVENLNSRKNVDLPSGLGTAIVANSTSDAELIRLGQELERLWQEENAFRARHKGHWSLEVEDLYEAKAKQTAVVAEQIGVTPAATMTGLLVKMRAVSWCCCGETFTLESLYDGETVDVRLASSILMDLEKIAAKESAR